MNLKMIRSSNNKIKVFNFKGVQVAELENSLEYDFLFVKSNVVYVKGVLDRHNKFKIKKIGLNKNW